MKTFKNMRLAMIIGLFAGAITGFICFRLTTVNAGNLEPTGPPGPTMKTLDEVEPRIPIPGSANPATTFVISSSGSYYLTGNRLCSGTGINVNSENVTIDLMGYSLNGPGPGNSIGINLNTYGNVEICNGTIRDFGKSGISQNVVEKKESRVINIRAISNGGMGIGIASYGSLIKDCTAAWNGDRGIYVGSGSTVIGNTVYGNSWDGISAGCYCTVSGNTSYQNTSWGIKAGSGAAQGCTITGNTVCRNSDGIYADAGSTVVANMAEDNTNFGIYLVGDCLVDQNTAMNNGTNMYEMRPCTHGVNHAP